MSLFGKTKVEDLAGFTQEVGLPTSNVEEAVVSKDVALVTSLKTEFSIISSGIVRQSQKKLQETNISLGQVESRLHNVKIYQIPLKRKAESLEMKLLYMRGGSPETIEQDLSQDEQDILTYLKAVANHLTSVIIELRDLRLLLTKVSVVPADPQMSPLESGREFGAKVVELIHKVERDLKMMDKNFVKIYELETEVMTVAQEHGVTFPPQMNQNQTPVAQQGQQVPQQPQYQ